MFGPSRITLPRRLPARKTVGVYTLKRGAKAPRDVLLIVSLFVGRQVKSWLRGRATGGTCSCGRGGVAHGAWGERTHQDEIAIRLICSRLPQRTKLSITLDALFRPWHNCGC